MQQRQSVAVSVSGTGPVIRLGLAGESLVSQFVIPSKKQLGGAKPFVFTERHGQKMVRVFKNGC